MSASQGTRDLTYDKNGNLLGTSTTDFDGTPVRTETHTYLFNTADSSDTTSNQSNAYWNLGQAYRAARTGSEVKVGAVVKRKSEYSYAAVNPSVPTSIELQEERHWDDMRSPSVPTPPMNINNAAVTTYGYDTYGNLTSITEPGRLVGGSPVRSETRLVYNTPADNFLVNSVNAEAYFLKQVSRAFGTPLAKTVSYTQNRYTAQVENVTDENNVITNTVYDPLGRRSVVTEGLGTAVARRTAWNYSVQNRRIIEYRDKDGADYAIRRGQHFDRLGRLWRSRVLDEASQSVNDPSQGIITEHRYHQSTTNGHRQLVSNPYKGTTSTTDSGWTMTAFDKGGRVKSTAHYSGFTAPDWNGTAVLPGVMTGKTDTVYDQTVIGLSWAFQEIMDARGNKKKIGVDSLGRVRAVIEDPTGKNYQTTYGYDFGDNLTSVAQVGLAGRTFTYSSLSRLLSATNPESGTTGYTYHPNGLLMTKLDARSLTTTFSYDALGRMTLRDYSDNTPDVTYCHDGTSSAALNDTAGTCSVGSQGSFANGRLSEVRAYNISKTRYVNFDQLGRVTQSSQVTSIGGTPSTYSFTYGYKPAGLAQTTYPSGRTVVNDYDLVGRTAAISLVKASGYKALVAAAQYAPHGGYSRLDYGGGPCEWIWYNNQLQAYAAGARKRPDLGGPREGKCDDQTPNDVFVFQLGWGYGATGANNGNVMDSGLGVAPWGTANAWKQQFYGYDSLNRLTSVLEKDYSSGTQHWTQIFAYDRYGNRAVEADGFIADVNLTPRIAPGLTAEQAATAVQGLHFSNRWNGGGTYPAGTVGHDLAGNQVTLPGGRAMTYDAENRMTLGSASSGGITYSASYAYDGEGRRVQKSVNGDTTTYVYDRFGQMAAEYSTVAPAELGTRYYSVDARLGSTRVVMDTAGNARRRMDYAPFGEELPTGMRSLSCGAGCDVNGQYEGTIYPGPAGAVREKFTGKERDSETGLDWFDTRYFSSAQGRFTSPDGLIAKKEWLADPQRWNHYAYVRNNPLRYIDPNGEDLVVYTFYGGDLTDEQKKYLQANMKQIQANIAKKFKDAGVDKVEFRDGSKLSQKQIDKILANGSGTNTTGIGLLNLSNEKFSGYQSKEGVFGATASDSRSAVFMKQVGEGLDLSKAGDSGIMNFRMGEVGAHELGHGQSFESDMSPINFMKQIFGGGNLMGEGQGMPTRSKQFDPSQDRTQRAIREINRIGDNTPKP